MALTLTTINAVVHLPDDAPPQQATLVFELKNSGFETGAGTTPPTAVAINLDSSGEGSVHIWANEVSGSANYYEVRVVYYAESPFTVETAVTETLGRISVPATGGPYLLADLLASYSQPSYVSTLDWGSIVAGQGGVSVQRRRGTAAEHASFVGAVGEVTVDLTNSTLRVHDGATSGGTRLARKAELDALAIAAMFGFPLYADVASGLAGTSDGQGFSVLDASDDIDLYLNNSGTEQFLTTVLSSGSVDWADLVNVPATFPPASHNHDDLYVPKTGGTFTGNVTVDVDGNSSQVLLGPQGMRLYTVEDEGRITLRAEDGAFSTFFKFFADPANNDGSSVLPRGLNDERYIRKEGGGEITSGVLRTSFAGNELLRLVRSDASGSIHGVEVNIYGSADYVQLTALDADGVTPLGPLARFELGTAATHATTAMTREKTDARYVPASGGTFTGTPTFDDRLIISPGGTSSSPNLQLADNATGLHVYSAQDAILVIVDGVTQGTFTNDGLSTGTAVVTRSTGDERYLLANGSGTLTGPLLFETDGVDSNRSSFDANAAGVISVEVGGVFAAQFDAAGEDAPAAQTAMTREKADARYPSIEQHAAVQAVATNALMDEAEVIDARHLSSDALEYVIDTVVQVTADLDGATVTGTRRSRRLNTEVYGYVLEYEYDFIVQGDGTGTLQYLTLNEPFQHVVAKVLPGTHVDGTDTSYVEANPISGAGRTGVQFRVRERPAGASDPEVGSTAFVTLNFRGY